MQIIQFVDLVLRQALNNLDITERERTDPIRYRVMQCADPKLLTVMVQGLVDHCTKIDLQVDWLNQSALGSDQSAFFMLQSTIDRLWGEGHFLQLVKDLSYNPPFEDLLHADAAALDDFLDSHWTAMNPYSWSGRCVQLSRTLIDKFLAPNHSGEARALIIQNPDFSKRESFNILYNLLVSMAERRLSPYSVIAFALSESDHIADPDRELFFRTLESFGIVQEAFALKNPNPHALNRLLQTLDLDEDQAREMALDLHQYFSQEAGSESKEFSPKLWLDAYLHFLQGFELQFSNGLDLADSQKLEEDSLSDVAKLETMFQFCQFEKMLEFVQLRDGLRRPLFQYLDLMATYPTNAHRYPEWLDAWLASSGPQSRYVAAAAHRELWFHQKNEAREKLHATVLQGVRPPNAADLQLIASWVLTLWRAPHEEMLELGTRFVERLNQFQDEPGAEMAQDLASVILLNLVVIDGRRLEKKETLNHLRRLYEGRDRIFASAPQLTTELCFLFDFLWNYAGDEFALDLVEVSRRDFKARSCFNRAVTLSNFASNLGGAFGKSGFYGEAIRYSDIGQALAGRTGNLRDMGIAVLEGVSHRVGSAAALPLRESEVRRGFEFLMSRSGSLEHVLHYYQQTVWTSLCARDWAFSEGLHAEAQAYIETHQLQGAPDARSLAMLGDLRTCLVQGAAKKPEPLTHSLEHTAVHANQAFTAQLVYEILYADRCENEEAFQAKVKAVEGYVVRLKQRIADAELSLLIQALLSCQYSWQAPTLTILRQGKVRYVETYFKAWSQYVDQRVYAESPQAQILLAGTLQQPILDQEIWLFVVEQFAKIPHEERLAYSLCLALMALLDPVCVEYTTAEKISYSARRFAWNKAEWSLPLQPIWEFSTTGLYARTPEASGYSIRLVLPGQPQTIRLDFRSEEEGVQCLNFFENSTLGGFILKMASNRFTEIQESRIRRNSRKFARRHSEEIRRHANEISDLLDQERKSLKITLLELQKQAMSRMKLYTSLFHDIKTPAQRTIDKLHDALHQPDDLQYRTLINQCVYNQKQIVDKLDKILLQSKNAIDAAPPQQTSLVWKDLCDKVCAQFIWEANRLQIDLRVADVSPQLRILGVEDQIEIILINILSNALKFTPPGGLIHMTAIAQASRLLVTVEDNGIGMSEEQIAALGGPLESQGISFGSAHKGSGLGLSVVKALIDAQDGQLHIESEPGKYTRVQIQLLLDESVPQTPELTWTTGGPRAEQVTSQQDKAARQGSSVLLIDADQQLLEKLAEGLSDSFDVITALHGQGAVRALQKSQFDFIICSYEIKPKGGIDLLQKLDSFLQKERTCFLMTAMEQTEDARRISLENGAHDFISKPFSIHELKQRLQNYLAARGPLVIDEHDKPDILQYRNYRQYLADCFQNRKNRRPSFSHRRLMQLVGAKSPSFFKRIVEGEVIVTSDMASRLAQVFGLSDLEKEVFFAMVAEGREGDGQSKGVLRARERVFRDIGNQQPKPLSALVQNSVWPAIILSLTKAKGFNGTAAWIATQLGNSLPASAIQAVLDSFVRQGMLKTDGQRIITEDMKLPIAFEESRLSMEALGSLLDLTRIYLDTSSVQALNVLFPAERKREVLALVEDAWMDFCSALRGMEHENPDGEGSGTEQEVCHISLVVAPCSHERSTKNSPRR